MKYWKRFWGSLNKGWKRVHYVLIGVPSATATIGAVLYFSDNPEHHDDKSLSVIALVVFVLALYYLLISAIYYIKEGFESKEVESTKED